MKQFIKENLKFYLFVALSCLFIGIAYTSADFFTAPASHAKDIAILFLQWVTVVAAFFPVIYLLSLNKYIFAASYPLIGLFSGILMYFRYTTGTTFTTMILDAALDNDTKINEEMISFGLIATVIASLALTVLFAVYRFKKIRKIGFLPAHALIAIVWLFVVFYFPQIKRPVSERIPMNIYFITSRYFSERREIMTEREVLSRQVKCNGEKPLVVLILGESLRADHLGVNAYERNTTPHLSDEDIISFPNVYSEYTHTNASLPHILTRADSIHPELAEKERSFVDLFKYCGYYTVWLANQEPAKSYVYFMKECDTLIYGNINKSTYVFDKWTDELLLPAFDLFTKNANDSRLIIMHTIGSHWYYNSHFTNEFQQFVPTTGSRVVSSNTKEEMINSYDNTVLYTDYFIYTIINRLRKKNAIIFFLSDHGEALGENGMWLHAVDALPVHNPASLIWMSPSYKEKHPEKYKTAGENRNRRYRTDFLFHTILESAGIESEVIDKKMSLLSTEEK
jgi:glucan phosphoethanolaminetransferase (alkaline phosphatase superfamily)